VLHLTSDGSYTHTWRQTTHKKLLLHKSRHHDLKREGNKKKENKTSFCGEFHKGCYLKKEEAETDVMVLDSYTGARLMSAKRGGGDETVAHHRRPAKTTTPVGMTAFSYNEEFFFPFHVLSTGISPCLLLLLCAEQRAFFSIFTQLNR
jgi:hypothetical protein